MDQRAFEAAVRAFQSGNLADAKRITDGLLKIAPKELNLLHLSGVIHLSADDLDTAVERFERILETAPDAAEILSLLAVTFKKKGDLSRARETFRSALKRAPRNVDLLYNAANLALQMGDLDGALRNYRNASKIAPGEPDFVDGVAETLVKKGDAKGAIKAIDAYEAANKTTPQLMHRRASAHLQMGEPEPAFLILGQALKHLPDNFEMRRDRLRAAMDLGQYEAAEHEAGVALQQRPNDTFVRFMMATLDEFASRLDDSRRRIDELMAEDGKNPELHFLAAKVYQRQKDLDRAASYADFARKNVKAPSQAIAADYLAAKIADGRGDYGYAMTCLADAKEKTIRADGAVVESRHEVRDRVKRTMDHVAAMSPAEPAFGDAGSDVAFLVGFPRSGTTMLDQSLDAHPEISTIEEQPYLENTRDKVADYPKGLSNLGDDGSAELRKHYMSSIETDMVYESGALMIDKHPLNMIDLPLIAKILPATPIIFALRDPRDVCLSCYMQHFALNPAMANFIDMKSTIDFYVDVMTLGFRALRTLNLPYHVVSYERMVGDQEQELRSVISFLGKEWDPAVMAFSEHAKSRGYIRTPSYQQVTQGLYATSVQRWQRYESLFEGHLDKLMPFVRACELGEITDV